MRIKITSSVLCDQMIQCCHLRIIMSNLCNPFINNINILPNFSTPRIHKELWQLLRFQFLHIFLNFFILNCTLLLKTLLLVQLFINTLYDHVHRVLWTVSPFVVYEHLCRVMNVLLSLWFLLLTLLLLHHYHLVFAGVFFFYVKIVSQFFIFLLKEMFNILLFPNLFLRVKNMVFDILFQFDHLLQFILKLCRDILCVSFLMNFHCTLLSCASILLHLLHPILKLLLFRKHSLNQLNRFLI